MMRTADFTVGQRVISAPGLHWMPTQRTGTVLEVNRALVLVRLDPTPRRPQGERKSFLRRNLQICQASR
jgi:hypothetical protein